MQKVSGERSCRPALANKVESRIGDQHFRNADAIGCLVVLQYSCNHPWQCQGTTVKGVGQACFVVVVPEAQFKPVCLECLKVGDRAYFKPALLCSGINFKIIGQGRGKADITTA